MKAAAFDYLRPRDIDEAANALAETAGYVKLIAGGQSLGPMLNLRLVRPSLLVDISRLEALRAIEDRGDRWRIGAAVTHARIEDAEDPLAGCRLLQGVARDIAYRAVRNRGTIGGSMAHADPAADWPLALAVLDAEIALQGRAGVRSVPADRFVTGAFTTAMREDELLLAVEVPKPAPAARLGYYKFCRKPGEFPEASAAVLLDGERGVARIFIGALDGAPLPLPALAHEIAERGAPAVAAGSLREALAAALPELDPIERQMRAAVLGRALRQALSA
jgi:carbon-monoxide dehydrogenase medium subunit